MPRLREQRIEILKELAKKGGGLITTAQIENAGISRVLIPTFVEEGILLKESRGIYYYADEFPDVLQIIQANNPRVIYSYGTALYLWNMSDRIPHVWDISVPQGFNATRIKKIIKISGCITLMPINGMSALLKPCHQMEM
jgi:hypothetical protein